MKLSIPRRARSCTATLVALAASLVLAASASAAETKPCTVSSNFNGTPIAEGDTIWFSAVVQVQGLNPSKKTTVSFTGSKVESPDFKFTAPDATVTFDPSATKATTTFTGGKWVTTVPSSGLAGKVFLDAVALEVPAGGLPGGVAPVSWSGTFSSSTPGLKTQWQWGAAVYTKFSKEFNELGVKPVDDNKASVYTNSDHAGTPEEFKAFVIGGATGGGGANYTGSYSGTGSCPVKEGVTPPQGSCQPASSLSALVTGTNVVSYVPKGNWSVTPVTDVSVVNVEGSSVTPTRIPTASVVNSCASNPLTGQTVCTANNTDVYVLKGTSIEKTLTSGGSGMINFSGGSCTDCGVAMDAVHNKALIGLSVGGEPGFQFLDLGPATFESPFASPAGAISEDPLVDPIRNLLLSAVEGFFKRSQNDYEIVNVATSTSPTFFENTPIGGVEDRFLDSSGEDCSTGIALAPVEASPSTSHVFIADLTQATFTPGSPGTWTAPSQVQSLPESVLPTASASGLAVAQGTHTGVVSGEFGGGSLTAIALPSTSGIGTPAISDWVTCEVGGGFTNGFDPHPVTAYQSPNGGDAIGLLANGGASTLARVDLTKMLNPAIVPRTVGGHGCASGTLPSEAVSFIAVP